MTEPPTLSQQGADDHLLRNDPEVSTAVPTAHLSRLINIPLRRKSTIFKMSIVAFYLNWFFTSYIARIENFYNYNTQVF